MSSSIANAAIAARLVAKAKSTNAVALIPEAKSLEMFDEDALALITEKAKLDAWGKLITSRQEKLKADLEVLLMAEGVEAVRHGDLILKQGKGRTGDKLVATRLLELGVPMDTLVKATEPGREYTFAQVITPKGSAPITTWEELQAWTAAQGE